MPISEGLDRAVFKGKEIGCEVIQIFTHNTTSWKISPISEKEIELFEKAKKETGIEVVSAHAGYLINLASPERRIWNGSIRLMIKEIERAKILKIPNLVLHPGSHKGSGEKEGIKKVAEALRRIISQTDTVRILLETTAGQGTSIGYRLEHLQEIMERVGQTERLGICIDTCHVFCAGYDLRKKEGYEIFMKEVENRIGLDYLFLLHINDSKKECGSRIDRHAHIGEGRIGEDAFRYFLKDKRLKDVPFIIETPKQISKDGIDYDIINLEKLRKMRGDER